MVPINLVIGRDCHGAYPRIIHALTLDQNPFANSGYEVQNKTILPVTEGMPIENHHEYVAGHLDFILGGGVVVDVTEDGTCFK